ncbi:protein-L-isoaspartate(D-aspartate) O-methyltransferase [Pseudopontixanthobacter vadosimaris]|uniref:protein-L-isoaspartate(D-aspartate) O-methyltransferase n=1 Tax=Pseudopontixanthobacter vadosimaris TaxID=2726450 RepID=UPI0030B91264
MAQNRARERRMMVQRQIAARDIVDPAILSAFREVPREQFMSPALAASAYDDGPLPIGEEQTISQPFIVACMIDAAGLEYGDRVLEVGAGSGYAAAIMSRIAGRVFAIERHEILARQARERIGRLGYDNCTIITGDGMHGLPREAPFDAILVAARVHAVPDALKRQLKVGGRLIVPVGGEDMQELECIIRSGEEEWTSHAIAPVRFVPLIAGTVPENGTLPAAGHGDVQELALPQAIAAACDPLPVIGSPHFADAFDRFADRKVVMLGECSHGTHEFYAARAAISQRLVEEHGFTIIAVEGDWPDAAAYDRFIRGKKQRAGAPPPFRRFPTWMWRNEVMPGFLRDLRALNEDRDPEDQVGFYGLDIYNLSGSIEAVLAYLDEHDREAAALARERYGCLTPWQADPATYGRASIHKGFAECEQAVLEQCQDLLNDSLAKDGGSFSAAMNARLVASAERYYRIMYQGGAASWNLRDSHMVETLEHLLERGGRNAKAVVWAHNSHIGDARAAEMGKLRGEHNIGQLARERWGEDVALIGFGTHAGTVSAASDWDGERETKVVKPSRRDSFERICHDSGVERFLLDMNADEALAVRLSEPLLQRFIGVIYRPETERWSHYSEAASSRQFDAYCWFDETRALKPLTSGEPHHGAAETFPSGL